jgi:hypothetical protein
VSDFRAAFLRARGLLKDGGDPEQVVPEVLAAAEAQEEIAMAESLYEDEDKDEDE